MGRGVGSDAPTAGRLTDPRRRSDEALLGLVELFARDFASSEPLAEDLLGRRTRHPADTWPVEGHHLRQDQARRSRTMNPSLAVTRKARQPVQGAHVGVYHGENDNSR